LEKLNAIIGQVGKERGYAFIINTDGNTCPFINPFMGEDVTQVVKDRIAQKQ
jgi:outer membrane protein